MTGTSWTEATCHACYGFEIGQQVDLAACEQRLAAAERQRVRSRRRMPDYFEYVPSPLRLVVDPEGSTFPGVAVTRVEITLYDFGAASVRFALSYQGALEGLLPISVALREEGSLARDARLRLSRLIESLGGAVVRANVASVVEDYFVFQLGPPGPGQLPTTMLEEQAATLARVLRASPAPLAAEEVVDALSTRLSFGTDDVTVIDWNAALIWDPEPEDTRTVLEFGNVQLLELRHLDGELDRSIERAYTTLARADRGWLHRLRPPLGAMREVAELQIDSAVLFERVSNAFKLVGDQFMGRVYRALSQRFHFEEWDRAILRKLDVLDRIHQKVTDQVSARRLEVLEWIVIVLIGLELFIR